MRKNLNVDDLGDLLVRPILAMLATRRTDGRILISPVWHEWVDGGFVMTTWANDIKSRNIKADPRITILVAEHETPYRSIEVSGEATIELLDDHMPIMRRLAARYVADEAYAETFRDDKLELIRLESGVIRAWDFNDTH
ncbi:MAG: TIGR03618 family F420-dependent PPOX class oxidoreductase [Proteobacteria bacterium]|nr:TIGR03618 family F420-dependent PPOX class oxidoreductase [Pseudomonadota bacterium]